MTNATRWVGLAAAVLGLMAGVAGQASADLIVSNLNEPSETINVADYGYRGQEFDAGNQAYLLTEIQAKVGNYTGSTYDPFALLESGNNNSPSGAVLTNFTIDQTISASQQNVVTFTPDSAVILAPNTNYWFILGTHSTSEFYWNYSPGNAASTGPGSLGSTATSGDQGTTWAISAPAFNIEAEEMPSPSPGP